MLKKTHYKIGWICTIETELSAARLLLDEEHNSDEYRKQPGDDNSYIFGRIGNHNIVIATLPGGEYGTTSAAAVAKDLVRAFPHIKVGLMVGIAGGAPLIKQDVVWEEAQNAQPTRTMSSARENYENMEVDVRLGDIVVSAPGNGRAGVYHYRSGKRIQDQQFLHTGCLNAPPRSLSIAVNIVKSDMRIRKPMDEGIDALVDTTLRKHGKDILAEFGQPIGIPDRLYRSSYVHPAGGGPCSAECTDSSQIINRVPRGENTRTKVHYGLIASADEFMKDALIRDELARQSKVLCFEMESAGLMNVLPFLVIRGICNYSDSHRNKEWQGYAAVTAAAYARKVLLRLNPEELVAEADVGDVEEISDQIIGNQIIRAAHAELNINESVHKADKLIRDYYQSGDRPLIKRLSGLELESEKC